MYIFLAPGFEEIEALAPADILRRAGIETLLVSCSSSQEVKGSHNITVKADIMEKDIILNNSLRGVVLPGGMPGAENLDGSYKVKEAVKYASQNNILIGAICAAPLVLGRMGLLNGKKATCFGGFEKELRGALLTRENVCTHGNIVTACAAGAAFEFAFEILSLLKDEKTAGDLKRSMGCKKL